MSEDCANPLLLGWIKEWLDQARERNSKGVTVWVIHDRFECRTDNRVVTRRHMSP